MAQNSQTQKPKWAMGSFFQQAVAGVESRLDNILLDEEERKKAANAKPAEAASTGGTINNSTADCTHCIGSLSFWKGTNRFSSDFSQRINCAQE